MKRLKIRSPKWIKPGNRDWITGLKYYPSSLRIHSCLLCRLAKRDDTIYTSEPCYAGAWRRRSKVYYFHKRCAETGKLGRRRVSDRYQDVIDRRLPGSFESAFR
jgi:hypothetical protein